MKQLTKKLNIIIISSLLLISLTLLLCNVNKNAVGAIMEYDRIEYLVHGSLKLLLKNGKVCYIDPFAGDNYKEIGDLILITHEHNDHNKVELVPNYKNAKIIRSADCFGENGYKTFDVLDMHIEPVEASNKNHSAKDCVGYVITSNGKKIYVAGDTSTTNQIKELSSYNIDYAFLPIDGKYNMDIDEAIECEKLINAKPIIPYHMASGELFSEERANKFATPTTLIMKPNDIIDIK